MTEHEQNILDRLGVHIAERGVSNEFLVELIKLGGLFLNIQTIPDYAKQRKKSYEGVRKCRHIEEVFNVRFVIDNE